MAVTELPGRSLIRSAKSPQGGFQPPISPLLPNSQGSTGIVIPPKTPKTWQGGETPVNSPIASSYPSRLSKEATSGAGCWVPVKLSPPIPVEGEYVDRYSFQSSGFTVPQRESVNRKLNDNDDGSDGSDNSAAILPSFKSLETILCYYEYLHHPDAPGTPLTPSPTPEPRYAEFYSRGGSLCMTQDTITEKLNCFRKMKNKDPLPPLEGLCEPPREVKKRRSDRARRVEHILCYRDLRKRTGHDGLVLGNYDGVSRQQPSPPLKMRKQRAKPKQGGKHLNVKYLVEELDYIRYHNVDLSQPWELVKVNFCAEFSHTKVADKRKVPGLQGGYYRQNKQLPHIVEGQLVFMENGHVEPACVQKREQKAKKHLFTLVYLFPERAQYPWMLPKDRQRAAELHKERHRQMDDARLQATKNGSYVEKLPSHILCGCCAGGDRERHPVRPKRALPIFKKRRHLSRAKL